MERYIRSVRTLMDAQDVALSEALEMARVPDELREFVRNVIEAELRAPVSRGNLVSERSGPRDWFQTYDPSVGYYWLRQRQYLIDVKQFSQSAVASLDDETDRVLQQLENPRVDGPSAFDIRGLIMGYVQSGKTANYCALIAKAADAGYKLVVVLSGIHNSLRRQTQVRLNKSLGIGPDGARTPEPGRQWIALTQAELAGDFNAGSSNAAVLQGNEHVLIVCKKNASVLRRLIRWMEGSAPPTLPVLVIDDEADQASINLGGNRGPLEEASDLSSQDIGDFAREDEIDPSVINGLVRQLVGSFHRVAYVAYTATPFANVLIDHEAQDRVAQADLYPRDFILSLPEPPGYCGAEALFGREILMDDTSTHEGLDVVDIVPEHEPPYYQPSSSQVLEHEALVTSSLDQAVKDFLLATAARIGRESEFMPATMLVHTSHRTEVQNRLAVALREHLVELRQAWRYDGSVLRTELEQRWNQRFRPLTLAVSPDRDVPFDVLVPQLDLLFRVALPVRVLNSSTSDDVDFEVEPFLKAIVVGGNRLSRGLTLEGLLVSYYIRSTDYYDTLMQMGRWFGFTASYVDLTRIWTTLDLAERFRDLALAEAELRREIARYEREGLTPRDFGPRIRSHPVMMITARGKMGSATRISQNYSEQLVQTTSFELTDQSWLLNNLQAATGLIRQMSSLVDPTGATSQAIWSGVPSEVVLEFLDTYRFDNRASLSGRAIGQYVFEQSRHAELTEWHVALRGLDARNELLGSEPALSWNGGEVFRISRTRLSTSLRSIGALINPAVRNGRPGSGDEEIGLQADIVATARADMAAPFPLSLRRLRDPRMGLLLLYPISPFSRPRGGSGARVQLFENPGNDGCTVLGLAMVFPASHSNATIEYVVGSVGRGGPEDVILA